MEKLKQCNSSALRMAPNYVPWKHRRHLTQHLFSLKRTWSFANERMNEWMAQNVVYLHHFQWNRLNSFAFFVSVTMNGLRVIRVSYNSFQLHRWHRRWRWCFNHWQGAFEPSALDIVCIMRHNGGQIQVACVASMCLFVWTNNCMNAKEELRFSVSSPRSKIV